MFSETAIKKLKFLHQF